MVQLCSEIHTDIRNDKCRIFMAWKYLPIYQVIKARYKIPSSIFVKTKKCVCLKWTGTISNKMLTVGLQVIFSSLRLFVFFTIKIYSFVIKKMVLKKHTHKMTLVPADLGRPSGLKQTVLAYRIPPTFHVPQAVYSYSFFLSKLAFQISHTWKMTLVNKHVLTGE